jgi:hypothetical protein
MKELIKKSIKPLGVTDIQSSAIGYASETSTLLSCGGILVSKFTFIVFNISF